MSLSSKTKLFQLGEVADIQTGPFGTQLHLRDYVKDGVPIITVEHLGNDRIGRENLPRVSKEDVERLSKYSIREGDTVFSRVGSVDRASYVHKEENGWLFSGRCLRVRPDPKKVNPRYLSFLLRSPFFTSYIKSIAVGATMPSINTSLLTTSPVNLLDLNEQNFVAQVLNAIELKIELSRKMNRTLEEMGQALFKHYFIDNPEAKDWKQVPVDVMFELTMGLSPKGDSYNLNKEGYPLLNGAGDFENGRLKPGRYTSEPTRISKKGDIIFCIRGTIGNVTIGYEEYCLGRGVAAMTPKKDARAYVYFSTTRAIGQLSSSASGSVIKGLSKPDIANREISKPPQELLTQYENVVGPFIHQLRINADQNDLLIGLRDSLLPRLMSGNLSL